MLNYTLGRFLQGKLALNIGFTILVVFLVAFNAFLISNFIVHNKSIAQSFSGVAGSSLGIADAVWQPELKSSEDGYTGILIMGIDSRDLRFDGRKFYGQDRDMDTIIQLVVNNKTGDVFMISIPRDTGVTVEEPCARQSAFYYRSINRVYKLAEDGNCPEGGVEFMKKYTEYITGFENHYFAVVSYDAFKDIINTVGVEENGQTGLYIDVPNELREYYPREIGGGFEYVYFRAGNQFINTDNLLKYARSRKATSDFDRARRQQIVLEALKDKLMEENVISDPFKLLELYRSFQNNALFSEVGLEEIRGGINLAQTFIEAERTDRVYNIILDDTFGGENAYITRPMTSGGRHQRAGYYLSPVHFQSPQCLEAGDEYCVVKQRLREMFDNPDSMAVLSEEATVFIYSNQVGVPPSSTNLEAGIAEFEGAATISRHALPMRSGWEDIQIYDFSDGSKNLTAKALSTAFSVPIRSAETAPFTPLNNDDFAIVVRMNTN